MHENPYIMNPKQIPKTMRAIVLQDYNSNLGRGPAQSLRAGKQVRLPAGDEVLVKMEAAPAIRPISHFYEVCTSLPALCL